MGGDLAYYSLKEQIEYFGKKNFNGKTICPGCGAIVGKFMILNKICYGRHCIPVASHHQFICVYSNSPVIKK